MQLVCLSLGVVAENRMQLPHVISNTRGRGGVSSPYENGNLRPGLLSREPILILIPSTLPITSAAVALV